MNSRRLLQRFLRYVKIDTTARADAPTYPSSRGQLRLGRLLLGELRAMGIADARQSPFGVILATVPATVPRAGPAIALCSHLDTSPETPGKGVNPQVLRKYPGGDLTLGGVPAGTAPDAPPLVIRVADNPELEGLVGRTLVTTDGTTLLGADDKAGVAIIMEAAAWLMEHPAIEHGPIRICFTCDEEIGHGVDHLDLSEIDAAVCYTLDGQGTDLIDVETFSADAATVVIRGVNIHPSIAKGRMTNAVRVAADFLARLPRDRLTPEATDGRDGFLHPYEIDGGVGQVKLHILLRDFAVEGLAARAQFLREAAEATGRVFPEAALSVQIDPQYRNMAEGLIRESRAVAYAQRALERLGRTARLTIVRGGTDGSRLTEAGLPCPNLSCGAYTPHSPLEWACLEEMVESVEWLVALAETWNEGPG